jgi:hypothetical protein
MIIQLPDGNFASYLYAGQGKLSSIGDTTPEEVLGGVRRYLGILGPTALRRLAFPRADETLQTPLSGFVSTLFDGPRVGAGFVSDGGGARLSALIKAGCGERARVDAADTFLRALYDARSRNGRACLAYELCISSARAITLRADPITRIDQGGQSAYATLFAAASPARVMLRAGSGSRPFDIQVGLH